MEDQGLTDGNNAFSLIGVYGGVELASSAPRAVVFDWCLAARRRQQIAAMASYWFFGILRSGRGENDAATVDYCCHHRCEIFAADFAAVNLDHRAGLISTCQSPSLGRI
jgi:hypothetical protein